MKYPINNTGVSAREMNSGLKSGARIILNERFTSPEVTLGIMNMCTTRNIVEKEESEKD